MSPEQEQLLNKLEAKLEELERQGMSLEEALDQMRQQERATAGPPALVKDMWPAQRVLNDALEAANSSNADDTMAALDRLGPLSAAIAGDLPASRIMVHCERALAFLSQNALDEAGVEMAMAHRIADGTKFATLVPEKVIPNIQNLARPHIQAGKPRQAADVVMSVLNMCARHESLARMQRIENAIEGARAAVDRGAWGVVQAELLVANGELTDLADDVRLSRWDISGSDAEIDLDAREGAEGMDEAAEDAEAARDAEAAAEEGESTAEADEAEAATGEGETAEAQEEPELQAGSARPR
ncbi:MAG: hypothetical protein GF393_10570 [Armatimonadia bacterium]|nr:hypothetical protein [Armatimonadia bacterium]